MGWNRQVLGIGDDAGVIKMIYVILKRADLLAYLAHGTTSDIKYAQNRPVTDIDEETLRGKVRQFISEDPFMLEQCSRAVTWVELGNPEAFFASCSTAADVSAAEGDLLERIAQTKTVVNAFRRSLKDSGRPSKALSVLGRQLTAHRMQTTYHFTACVRHRRPRHPHPHTHTRVTCVVSCPVVSWG